MTAFVWAHTAWTPNVPAYGRSDTQWYTVATDARFFFFFFATVVNEKHAPPAVQSVAEECHIERAKWMGKKLKKKKEKVLYARRRVLWLFLDHGQSR